MIDIKTINCKKVLTGISGATLLLALFFSWALNAVEVANILYFIAILAGGYYVFLGALKELFGQRFLNIDFLVTVAAVGAVYINQLAEAAAVVFFFSLAEAFEEFGVERSRRALEVLVKKSPQTAIRKDGNKVAVERVRVNSIIIVRPGDLIPLDGVVVKGTSFVDEATITGEPIPKDKHKGDGVFAGTLNQQGEQVMGALAISDKIRKEAHQAIKKLSRLGILSAILSGDNQHAASSVAKTLGIKKVYASLLPDEKVKRVEELKQEYRAVAMVGDDINDAPSLATATVGIAIGTDGSDVAIETANVTLMNSNLLNIPYSIRLRKTFFTIKQNVTAAPAVKALFLSLAVLDFTHLEYAIGADPGVAILVILNGLRLFHQT